MKKTQKISTEKTFEMGDLLFMAELNQRFSHEQSRTMFANSICHVGPYIDNQATRLLLSTAQIDALTALGKIDFDSPASNKRIAGLLTYIREKSVPTVSETEVSDCCSDIDFQRNVIFFMIWPENGEPLIHWRQKAFKPDTCIERKLMYPEIRYDETNDLGYFTFSKQEIVKRIEYEDKLLVFEVDSQEELVGIKILSVTRLVQKYRIPTSHEGDLPKEMIPVFLIPHIYQYRKMG